MANERNSKQLGTIPGTSVDGAFPPWNFNVCTILTSSSPMSSAIESPRFSMISGFFRGIFCYRWDLNCYIFKICPEKSHGHSRIELRRQCILDHILSLCIGISVKAVAAESSPFIVVTDHFSDGIDIDTSVYQ